MNQENFAVFGTLFGTIATAMATFALWRTTRFLAVETKRLADASSQPQVVATIVPNIWSTIHLDIAVENTGNATAFDIELSFNPPLSNDREIGDDDTIPLQKISLLKPGQSISSYLDGVGDYLEKNFEVTASWKRSPTSIERETLTFWLNMADFKGVSYLGARDPRVQIAEQLKELREDWRNVASGTRKIKSEIYDSTDRQRERDAIDKRYGRNQNSKMGPSTEK